MVACDGDQAGSLLIGEMKSQNADGDAAMVVIGQL
jgi:hypothetical protein